MATGRMITTQDAIHRHLAAAATIAVVGLSPKPQRDSHRVSAYMQRQGYRIIPVRPAQKTILGEPALATLDDVAPPVDIVNVFRHPKFVMDHAREALRLKPALFWMQEGISHFEAAMLLTEAGIDVVMDRCIMIDHQRMTAESQP
jgi:predicted CoA-binding protein